MPEGEGLFQNEQLPEKQSLPASQDGFVHFITLRLLSTTRTLYCAKEKTFIKGHGTFTAKQIQAGYFTRFYPTVIRSEILKAKKRLPFLLFSGQ